jgi:zinc protease
VPPSSPEWLAFRLMQSLTSGLGGTFFAELRGRQSLAYTVSAGPVSFATQGAFRGYLAGEAGKEDTARKALLGEMRALQDRGITDEDLARAKAFYAGSSRTARETNNALASDYGRNYILGLPLDFVERTLRLVPGLTAQDLRDAARRHLAGDNYVYAALRGKASAD